MDFLSKEGHLYSSVDGNHFNSTSATGAVWITEIFPAGPVRIICHLQLCRLEWWLLRRRFQTEGLDWHPPGNYRSSVLWFWGSKGGSQLARSKPGCDFITEAPNKLVRTPGRMGWKEGYYGERAGLLDAWKLLFLKGILGPVGWEPGKEHLLLLPTLSLQLHFQNCTFLPFLCCLWLKVVLCEHDSEVIASLQKKCCYHFCKVNVSICWKKQFYWEAIGIPLLSQGGGKKERGPPCGVGYKVQLSITQDRWILW